MTAFPPSTRGQQNVKPNLMIDLSRRVAQNAYDEKTNPTGIIDLGSASNALMRDEVESWVKRTETAGDIRNCSYRNLKYNDTRCAPHLPAAAATFVNTFFHPRVVLTPTNILVANGLTALLDTLFFNLADAGAAVLVPTPSYGMFQHDLAARNGLHLVPVPCDDIIQARFRQHVRPGRPQPELLNRLKKAAQEQRALGRPVAAVLLANPDNPLAACYSSGMLRWIVKWCRLERVHLVVDEVYALSGGEEFQSVLHLGLDDMLENVHVLYGMSKDFGLGGCRVGFLATYNEQLYRAMRTCSMFTWVSAFGGIIATRLLSDTDYISQTFLPKFQALLKERRDYLATILPDNNIGYSSPNAAFFVYVNLQPWLSYFAENEEKLISIAASDSTGSSTQELALLEHLIHHGVFLEPGQAFFAQEPGHFRLNYGIEGRDFVKGLARLLGALRALSGEKLCAEELDVGVFDGRQQQQQQQHSGWRFLSCLDSS
ncbi:pyridoxal phosphate-dependent transferase [Coniella lustricola]|uniref:Pyridoxal phosphate-dependent transferase n=1 Tax=Coniella lustricola TaxID=2025994 RepID=A0A2T3AIL5_9PEZI|nr:pyridoxal phosphate-dependent transferase [Coniella lustricola]